jgi:hypothetical protein
MSVPKALLSADELKAPPGQFRVLKIRKTSGAADFGATHFLVGDFPDKAGALDRWRSVGEELRRNRKDGEVNYWTYIHDDHGRIVDAVGTFITKEELKAPPGQFRIVCLDFAGKLVLKLVNDLDDHAEAIRYARTANEGPYTGFQVYDDTGAPIIPAP